MDSRLSLDSLGESELELLRDKIKQKEKIIAEQSEIITSLRNQVNDWRHDCEEMENSQQFLQQKVDRLTKEVEQKDEEMEAVSHALKEFENSHDTLSKKLEARTSQLQKTLEDLMKSKKELEETKAAHEEQKHRIEHLTVELEAASRKRSWQDRDVDIKSIPHDNQVKFPNSQDSPARQHRSTSARSLESNHSRYKSSQPERLADFVPSLAFETADEVGEFMDSSSALARTQPRKPQLDKQVISQSPGRLTRSKRLLNQSINDNEKEIVKKHNAENQITYCPQHQSKRVQAHENIHDPIAEYKMRVDRANELARRNMRTKPLHQTSYPLELDTFDTTDLTEQEIKRGNVAARQMKVHEAKSSPPPPLPKKPNQLSHQHSHRARPALANFSNTPPRRVYKKAEAFIV